MKRNWKEIRKIIINERKFNQTPVINYLLAVLFEVAEKNIYWNRKITNHKANRRKFWKENELCSECGSPTGLSKSGKKLRLCAKCQWNRRIDVKNYRSRLKLRNSK